MDGGQLDYSLRLRLGRDPFFGPGTADLMRRVDRLCSLRLAAQEMGMAYSKAWRILKEAERRLGFRLMERKVGGQDGGGSVLTPQGRDFLQRYLSFQREAYDITDRLFERYFPNFTSWEE